MPHSNNPTPDHPRGRHVSPLSEGAQVPHSDLGPADGNNGVGAAPDARNEHELSGDRERAQEQGSSPAPADTGRRQDSSIGPPGLAASQTPHPGTHGSGTGAEAEPYEAGAESGNYEGEGFNRGYGVAPGARQDRSDGYRDARHGKFGDVQDDEDLYGEGRPRASED